MWETRVQVGLAKAFQLDRQLCFIRSCLERAEHAQAVSHGKESVMGTDAMLASAVGPGAGGSGPMPCLPSLSLQRAGPRLWAPARPSRGRTGFLCLN